MEFNDKICKQAPKFSPTKEELIKIIKTLYKDIKDYKLEDEIEVMSKPWWTYKKIDDSHFVVIDNQPMADRSWMVDTDKNKIFLLWLS